KLLKKKIQLSEPKTLSQYEVVKSKALQAYEKLKKPVIVDDTGIYFEEYKDFPGTHTKYLFKTIGFKGLQKLLFKAKKNAYFKTLICYKDKSTTKIFSGVWKGIITTNISSSFNPDWQYNSIFIPEGFKKTLSEISVDERIKHSHRRKALQKLMSWLKDE
ncbi:MAG: non-canonical purine NTP pyrophosphatase, partial [Nanoarchaeota archaeon]|nr:non-canonical purine NTP pyrophosphatase [Nanoarchaeota archaeon]